MLSGELEIIHGLQTIFQGPIATTFVTFCARWMIFLFAGLAAATSIYRHRKGLRHAAYEAAWSALLALAIAMVLGTIIGRARPFHASPEIHLLIPPPASTYSFPSGHAAVAFAIAAALAYGNPSFGVVALLLATLVAFGRVATGVHYPSDVLAGALVGYCAFAIVRFVHRALRKRDLTPSS